MATMESLQHRILLEKRRHRVDGLHSQPVDGGRILGGGGCRNKRDQQQSDGIHVRGVTAIWRR